MIAYNTPLELVEQLKSRIQAYITANNREWSGCAVNIDKMDFQNAIHLTVAVERKSIYTWLNCEVFYPLLQIARTGRTGEDAGHGELHS